MYTTMLFDMTSAAWLRKPRYISSCGGTRSGKTYSIIQLLILQLLGEDSRQAPPTINSVCSESIPHLKRGCIRDFKAIMQGEGIWDENRWNESDKFYTFANGSVLEFFSVDNAGKVFGASRDNLFINECQHISYEIFRQLAVRTRGHIILDYNPTHQFWVMDKVESKDNCIRIHSTYRDNAFLTAAQVQEIEASQGDENWWKVFGLGEVGTLDGLIYDFEVVDRMPQEGAFTEMYGLDFGYVNDPTALVHILADHRTKTLYVEELCYNKGMLNKDIVDVFKQVGIPKHSTEIFADSAEQKSIAELAMYGYNVKPCYKGKAVTEQIAYVKGWKMRVTKASLNLIKELRNYCWLKDKDGKALNQPQDLWNHCADAMRYALFTKYGDFKRPSRGGKPQTMNAW